MLRSDSQVMGLKEASDPLDRQLIDDLTRPVAHDFVLLCRQMK